MTDLVKQYRDAMHGVCPGLLERAPVRSVIPNYLIRQDDLEALLNEIERLRAVDYRKPFETVLDELQRPKLSPELVKRLRRLHPTDSWDWIDKLRDDILAEVEVE